VKSFWTHNHNRWIILTVVFVIGPGILYLTFINSSMQQIAELQKRLQLESGQAIAPDWNMAPASDSEREQLEQAIQTKLARIKKIDTRDSLLHFNGILADALASQALSFNLKILSVDLQHDLITGRYIPKNDRALDMLRILPGVQWDEIADPLTLPLLKLPSMELNLTVAGEYSQVFSYIESLSDFPAQVLFSGLWMIEDSGGRAYRMKIRGFYYGAGGNEYPAQADTTLTLLKAE
jgi:hypothetical protein